MQEKEVIDTHDHPSSCNIITAHTEVMTHQIVQGPPTKHSSHVTANQLLTATTSGGPVTIYSRKHGTNELRTSLDCTAIQPLSPVQPHSDWDLRTIHTDNWMNTIN